MNDEKELNLKAHDLLTVQIVCLHQSHPNTVVMATSGLSYLCQMFQYTNHLYHACHSEAQTAKICSHKLSYENYLMIQYVGLISYDIHRTNRITLTNNFLGSLRKAVSLENREVDL